VRTHAAFISPLIVHSYPHSRLLEINSHSLFSRWFSESGKLVQKLFGTVMELVEDEDTFVVVLIGTLLVLHSSYLGIFLTELTLTDEVESLTAARAGAMAGTEPTDALRVHCHNFNDIMPKYKPTGRERPTYTTRQASTQEKRVGCGHKQSRQGDRSVINV